MGLGDSGDRYLIQSVVHASSVLRAFQSRGEVLRLRDVVERTGFPKGRCFLNAEHFVREKVDLVIEFQIDEAIAPAISSRYLDAKIPFIAVHVPHPGGTYYGANNYQAGLLAGHYLARWARTRWNGQVDEVLLVDAARAGSLVHGRIAGVLTGLTEALRDEMRACKVVTVDGDGQFTLALERVRRYLGRSDQERVLVGAVNDFERARRGTRVPGGRPRRLLRHRRAERRAGRARRAPRAPDAPGRIGRLFPGALRRGTDRTRPGDPGRQADAAGQVREAPGDHTVDPGSVLSE